MYQVGSGHFQRRYPHPLKPKSRLTFNARSREELDAKVARFEQFLAEVEEGYRSRRELERIIERLTNGVPTLDELLEQYEKTITNARTKSVNAQFRRWARPLLEERAEELYAPKLVEWISSMRAGGLGESTVHLFWEKLVTVVRFGVAAKRLDEVPWLPWRPRFALAEVERDATRNLDEVLALFEAAKNYDLKLRAKGPTFYNFSSYFAKTALGLILGLRNGELAGLGWDDVRYEALRVPDGAGGFRVEHLMVITVRHQATPKWRTEHPTWTRPLAPPKGRKIVSLIAPKPLALIVEEHRRDLQRHRQYKADGPVFPRPNDDDELPAQWLDANRAIRPEVFREITKAAGLGTKGWTTHSLRHSFCTLEISANGGDIRAAMEASRHSTLESFVRYLHTLQRRPVQTQLELPSELAPKAKPPIARALAETRAKVRALAERNVDKTGMAHEVRGVDKTGGAP
jgi:integrase